MVILCWGVVTVRGAKLVTVVDLFIAPWSETCHGRRPIYIPYDANERIPLGRFPPMRSAPTAGLYVRYTRCGSRSGRCLRAPDGTALGFRGDMLASHLPRWSIPPSRARISMPEPLPPALVPGAERSGV